MNYHEAQVSQTGYLNITYLCTEGGLGGKGLDLPVGIPGSSSAFTPEHEEGVLRRYQWTDHVSTPTISRDPSTAPRTTAAMAPELRPEPVGSLGGLVGVMGVSSRLFVTEAVGLSVGGLFVLVAADVDGNGEFVDGRLSELNSLWGTLRIDSNAVQPKLSTTVLVASTTTKHAAEEESIATRSALERCSILSPPTSLRTSVAREEVLATPSTSRGEKIRHINKVNTLATRGEPLFFNVLSLSECTAVAVLILLLDRTARY